MEGGRKGSTGGSVRIETDDHPISKVVSGAGFGILLLALTPARDLLAPYIPKNIKPYFLDMLLLRDQPDSALPAAERPQWLQKHLAYIRSPVELGRIVVVGPIAEENRLRGMAISKADSPDEAQRIASRDPLVQSGHFAVEVHPFVLEDLSSIRFDYPAEK